jgi:hypothetical protein
LTDRKSTEQPRAVEGMPVTLPEDLGMLIDQLRAAHDAIEEVWLIGDRVNLADARAADWELLLFADHGVLDAIRRQPEGRRGDVQLSVVVDGDRVEPATDGGVSGRLSRWRWRRTAGQQASYTADESSGTASVAVRVR